MQTIVTTPSRPTLTTARAQAANRRGRRRWVDFLAVVVVLFILQTGLAPYDFLSPHTEAGFRTPFSISINRVTRPDILSNIFLYVPFGLLICVALTARMPRRSVMIGYTFASAAILSVGIEWVQSFSATRVSSLIDVASNVLGAGVGVVLSAVLGPLLSRLGAVARTELVLRPHGTVVKAYVVVLCIAAAAPFDLSFDVGHLRTSWKSASATLAPLSIADHGTTQPSGARFGVERSDYARWGAQKRWARWGAEGVSFAAFAWLATAWLRREYAFGRATSGAICLWIGAVFATGLSVLQLPILSRGFDAMDVAFRWLGLLAGCGAGWWRAFDDDAVTSGESLGVASLGGPRGMRFLCCATGLYVAYTGLIPIGVKLSRPSEVLSWSTLIPFSTYPLGRFDEMMCDAMEKLGAFMLFAFLFSTVRQAAQGGELRRGIVRTSALCAGLAAVIEVAQSVIPPRTPSLTDVLLAATGAALGCVLQDRVSSLWLGASRRRAKLAGVVPTSARPARVFTPLDELIGSLAEPKADAPTETKPPVKPALDPRTP